MNALNSLYRLFPTSLVAAAPVSPVASARPATVTAALPANPAPAQRPERYRRRDYGTGYGRSSGYAQDRSYAGVSSHRLVRVG